MRSSSASRISTGLRTTREAIDYALRKVAGPPLARPLLTLDGPQGYEAAAELYRVCRRAGETVHGLTHCLVAVPTIAADAELLHADRDFEILARHTPLRVVEVAG